MLASRDPQAARDSAAVVNLRARLLDCGTIADAVTLHWETPGFLNELIEFNKPKLIIHTASYQSPWEFGQGNCRWAALVRNAGYGITFPLQAYLAIRVAGAIKESQHKPILVNACYPDTVNSAVHASGLPIFCGLGNIMILAALLQSAAKDDLTMIAHHYHLSELQKDRPAALPRVWRNGEEQAILAEQFSWSYLLTSMEVNHVTACTALPLIQACLSDCRELKTHVPGPNGLAGGYPVVLDRGNLHLRLPEGVEIAEAVRWNTEAALQDGVQVAEDGHVRFSERACSLLSNISAELARGFHLNDLSAATDELLKIRQVLRLK